MTPEKRVHARNRSATITEADERRGLALAREAADITAEMQACSELTGERDRLWLEANDLGISRQRLADIAGRARHVVDVAITRARANGE